MYTHGVYTVQLERIFANSIYLSTCLCELLHLIEAGEVKQSAPAWMMFTSLRR